MSGSLSRIVEAIRASAPELIVGIRLSAEGEEEAGHTLEGLGELLPHVAPIVDYVNLTVGVRTTYVKDMGTEQPPLLDAIERLRPLVAAAAADLPGLPPRRAVRAGARVRGGPRRDRAPADRRS